MNDEYLKALGLVVVNFSSLDFYLSCLIWVLIGSELDIGKSVTSEMSFNTKVKLFASLYRIKVDSLNKGSDIRKLITGLEDVEKDRNNVMHSSWLIDEKNTKVTRYKISAKSKHGLRNKFEDFDVSKLNKIADSIGDVTKKINELISKSLNSNPQP